MRISPGLALAVAAALAACARNPRPGTPDPRPAPAAAQPAPAAAPAPTAAAPAVVPDLAGEWEFSSTIGEGTVGGILTLTRAGASYSGSAQSHEGEVFPLTSLKLEGGKVVMMFDTPEGPARVESTLTGANAMSGTVMVGEMTGTFAARKK